jgi:hypothetical protein
MAETRNPRRIAVRQGHATGKRLPRGKNVQVYYYLGKGQKAHYGGKKDEREAIFLSPCQVGRVVKALNLRDPITGFPLPSLRFDSRSGLSGGCLSSSAFSYRLALHMVPISYMVMTSGLTTATATSAFSRETPTKETPETSKTHVEERLKLL